MPSLMCSCIHRLSAGSSGLCEACGPYAGGARVAFMLPRGIMPCGKAVRDQVCVEELGHRGDCTLAISKDDMLSRSLARLRGED